MESFIPTKSVFLLRSPGASDLPRVAFSYIKARHTGPAKDNPYEVLGITCEISNDVLKIHYRKLVADNHPDKMLRGLRTGVG